MLAFERLEPFGGLHDEFIGGQVAAVVANANRDSKRRPEPFTAADFMPGLAKLDGRREEEPILLEDAEQQSTLLRALFSPREAANG